MLGASGAAASAPTLWQATVAAFKHLGRETAEAIADSVVQEVTGLPVGPSDLLPKKGKAPKAKASPPKKAKALRPKSTWPKKRTTPKAEPPRQKKGKARSKAKAKRSKRKRAKPKNGLRRPYLRKDTRTKIENAAEKTPEGKFIGATNKKVIEGKYHYGHIEGREHRRLVAQAEDAWMTQAEFNDWINSHPEWFQIEDPDSNLSHRYEKSGND